MVYWEMIRNQPCYDGERPNLDERPSIHPIQDCQHMTQDYTIRLTLEDEVVYEATKSTQSDVMVAVTEFLIRERDLLNIISLPYSPGRKKSPLLGRTQDDLHGQKHEVGAEYYVDTLANRETKKRNIARLAAECGLGVEFDGAW